MNGLNVIVMVCMLGAALAQTYSWYGPGGTTKSNRDYNACKMDTGSCSCCYMMRMFYNISMRFNDTMDQLERDLTKVQSSFNNMRSSQIAFSTALTKMRRCVGPYRADTILMYMVVFSNLGDAYSNSTGVFAVPRSGVYFFSVTVFSDAGSPGARLNVCAKLMLNGKPQVMLSERNNEDQEDSSSASLLLSLRAGDQVYMQLPAGCFLCDDQDHYNTFMGYLLYATD